jgi:hypothetical protein
MNTLKTIGYLATDSTGKIISHVIHKTKDSAKSFAKKVQNSKAIKSILDVASIVINLNNLKKDVETLKGFYKYCAKFRYYNYLRQLSAEVKYIAFEVLQNSKYLNVNN